MGFLHFDDCYEKYILTEETSQMDKKKMNLRALQSSG